MVRIILSITAVIFALPALYVVFSAFQDGEGFGLGKFRELFQNYPSYLVALRNSFFYAVIITAGGLFT